MIFLPHAARNVRHGITTLTLSSVYLYVTLSYHALLQK